MLREIVTIVLPLILPTALYLAWVSTARRRGRDFRAEAVPWVWLAGAGAVLLGLVLFVITVHFGSSVEGVYIPPRYENGRVIPSRIEPKP